MMGLTVRESCTLARTHEHMSVWAVVPQFLLDSVQDEPPAPPPSLHGAEQGPNSVRAFLSWAYGEIECLPACAASDFGFDGWLYVLRHRALPTPAQDDVLKHRILELLQQKPLAVVRAIEQRQMHQVLGPSFEWVQVPRQW